jgi:anti-repressor protein
MSNIQIFNYQSNEVRTVEMGGEPWFVLKDVCNILGISKYRDTAARLDADERGSVEVDTLGGTQQVIAVNESGLYHVILRSDKPEAAPFRKWVTSEVLPSIRKHGAYMTPETLQAAILNPDTMIQLCQQLKTEQDKNKALSEENAKLAPKGLFADAVSVSDRCILVSELAKLLKQNGIETGQNRLYEQLRADGFLVKDRKRSDFNMPTQKAMELGLFKVRESTRVHSDGHTTIDKTTKVTGKGQIYLINYYLKKQ